MAEIAWEYYQSLYRLEDHDSSLRDKILNCVLIDSKRIKSIDYLFFEENVVRDDVKRALAQAETRKSPGADGIPVEIYQVIESQIVELLTEMMNETIDTERTSHTQNTGLITLIHKKGDKPDLNNWRPISLLCSDNKLMAKVMANRLKSVLEEVTEPEQTGGIEMCNISENLCNMRNIIACTEGNSVCGTIISLDFEKAFDRVD